MDVQKIKELLSLGFTHSQISEMINPGTKEVNTSTSTNKINNTTIDSKLHAVRNHKLFKSEKQVEVKVPVPYGKMTGGYIHLGINGVVIEIPCDNVARKIPKSFANLLEEKLTALDAQDSARGYLIGEVNGLLKEGKITEGSVVIAEKSYN